MSLNRDDMLRELELLPVWKQRELPPPGREAAVPEVRVPVSEEPRPAPEPVLQQVAEVAPVPDATEVIAEVEVEIEAEVKAEPAVFAENRLEQIRHLDWQALQACVQSCVACELSVSRTQTVFGVGDPQAEWLFVGEAPGVEEDRKGEPFVGQAGKLLDNMLAAIKLKRGQNTYIANIMKCRPPENRDPHRKEIVQCEPFLERQVALMQPKLILALGRVASQTLLQTDATVAELRGKLHSYNGVPVIVTYHPAYLLRNLADKAKAWEDLCFARRTMQELQTAGEA
ncbi:MAG: DNA polymerase III [Betaproteobacteria bacterium HGW-Betaproteobacteria-1]|jgi:DNA polymerase|nr:MAG: DNA polymerase III [Betaproteobacteria bacterium HGW-Betaproteobacteria-1]